MGIFRTAFSILFFIGNFSLPSGENPLIEKEEINYLLDFYKDIHQNPEISLREKETSKKLAIELRKVGYEVTEDFGGFGVVGILKKWRRAANPISHGHGCPSYV